MILDLVYSRRLDYHFKLTKNIIIHTKIQIITRNKYKYKPTKYKYGSLVKILCMIPGMYHHVPTVKI